MAQRYNRRHDYGFRLKGFAHQQPELHKHRASKPQLRMDPIESIQIPELTPLVSLDSSKLKPRRDQHQSEVSLNSASRSRLAPPSLQSWESSSSQRGSMPIGRLHSRLTIKNPEQNREASRWIIDSAYLSAILNGRQTKQVPDSLRNKQTQT